MIKTVLDEIEDYVTDNFVPIITKDVADFLRVLCRIKKPTRIFEIGTAVGYSTLVLSENLPPDGEIVTVERHDKVAIIARDNFIKAGKQNQIKQIFGEAKDALGAQSTKYDLIFLDGAKAQYLEFLPMCLEILNEDGILIADNVLYHSMVKGEIADKRDVTIVKRMRDFLDVLTNHPKLQTSVIDIGDGVSISVFK